MPMVAMMGLTPILVTMMPLLKPMNALMPRATAKAKMMLFSGSTMMTAAASPEAFMMAPIDRSKPPEIISKVANAAAIPVIETARPMLKALRSSKKYGDWIVK